MSAGPTLSLFAGYGIEIEFMVVDRQSLSVRPVVDALFETVMGHRGSDVEDGPLWWSNELVAHVLELKTAGPVGSLEEPLAAFEETVQRVNRQLESWNAMLLPGGMHPFMDPETETRLWPEENHEIYAAFDRVFDCKGHGWSNLQSTHLNLPFSDDDEFRRLHAAIRVLLPILPMLASSSPIVDGKPNGLIGNRMNFYRSNSDAVPSVAGQIIPESVASPAEYHERILSRIFADIAPLDPTGVLRHEWLNARGAIPRFSRNTIEIRVLDSQECPRMDLALTAVVVEVLKDLVEERWCSFEDQFDFPQEDLVGTLGVAINPRRPSYPSPAYFQLLQLPATKLLWPGQIWEPLIRRLLEEGRLDPPWRAGAEWWLERGPLWSRLMKRLGQYPSHDHVLGIYRELADCLQNGRMFE